MIVVDTSVWVDHLRSADQKLSALIAEAGMLQHPYVTGEIVVGNLHNRNQVIRALRRLPQIDPVSEADFHAFTEETVAYGTGLGFVDIHLLAATAAFPGARLWTKDRRMREHAERLGLAQLP